MLHSPALLRIHKISCSSCTSMPDVPLQGEKDDSRSDLEAANVSARDLDGPKFKFWVSDRHKQKLDYARATALLFTLNLVFGTEVRPTQDRTRL